MSTFSPEILLLNVLSSVIADEIYQYILHKIPVKRIRDINIRVEILSFEKRLFEIEVSVETDPLVKQEVIDQIVEKAVNFGFKILDNVINEIEKFKDSININIDNLDELEHKIKRIVRKIARKYINNNS